METERRESAGDDEELREREGEGKVEEEDVKGVVMSEWFSSLIFLLLFFGGTTWEREREGDGKEGEEGEGGREREAEG